MKNKIMKNKNLIRFIIFFVLSVVFTILIKTVDVKEVGINSVKVGFSTINSWFRGLLYTGNQYSKLLYCLTKYLGYLPILSCGVYGGIGLMQLIKSKSLKKVDKEIIILGIFYVVVLLTYILFEKVVINYRPVIIDVKEGLEASFPSSHTVLAICMIMASIIINKLLFENKYTKMINAGSYIVLVIIVIGRLFSGVHWLTDIIGGVLISCALINLLKFALRVEE